MAFVRTINPMVYKIKKIHIFRTFSNKYIKDGSILFFSSPFSYITAQFHKKFNNLAVVKILKVLDIDLCL